MSAYEKILDTEKTEVGELLLSSIDLNILAIKRFNLILKILNWYLKKVN